MKDRLKKAIEEVLRYKNSHSQDSSSNEPDTRWVEVPTELMEELAAALEAE